MKYILSNLDQMGYSKKDMEIVEAFTQVKTNARANKVDIINFKGGDMDDAFITHFVKNKLGKTSMKILPKEQIGHIAGSRNMVCECSENIVNYIDELGGEYKDLIPNALVIEGEPYFFTDHEHTTVMLGHKAFLERTGGTVLFVVRDLDKKTIHKFKVDHGLNTMDVTIDYSGLAAEMYNKIFGYQPEEEMIQTILKAIKNVSHLSVAAIKHEIEYLYDICSASEQPMPGSEFAKNVLMVEGEKSYTEMFDELVGLETTKQELMNIVKSHIISKRLKGSETVTGLRLALSGKPGTGKSTLVKMIVAMLKQEGALEDGSACKIISARELIGTAIGHSEDKINKLVAENDVIVLDEIGALCPGSDGRSDSFTEAVNKLLVYYMEADSTKGKHFIFIGYPDEVKAYIEADAGLSSRVKNIIHLEDYNSCELVSIANLFLKQEKLELEDYGKITRELEGFVNQSKNKDLNARDMRNLVEYVKEGAYVKCFDEKLTLDDGVRINCEDVRKGIDTYARKHKPATKESRPIGFAPVTVDAIN